MIKGAISFYFPTFYFHSTRSLSLRNGFFLAAALQQAFINREEKARSTQEDVNRRILNR